MKVKIKKLTENAVIPQYAHPTDAGLDMVATSRHFDEIGNLVYGTGLAIEIPEGHVGLLFPRSSISKYDLMLSNAVGCVDSGYRGEITFKFRPNLVYVDNELTDTKHKAQNKDYEGSVQTDPLCQSVLAHGLDNTFFGNVNENAEGRAVYKDTEGVYHQTLDPRIYEVGEKIGQLIILPYPCIELVESDELSETDRGTGGYGSTGR